MSPRWGLGSGGPGGAVAIGTVASGTTYTDTSAPRGGSHSYQVAMLDAAGLPCPTITSGGTPDIWQMQTGGVGQDLQAGRPGVQVHYLSFHPDSKIWRG